MEAPTNRYKASNLGELCTRKVPDMLDKDKWIIFILLLSHAADKCAPQEAVAPVQLSLQWVYLLLERWADAPARGWSA